MVKTRLLHLCLLVSLVLGVCRAAGAAQTTTDPDATGPPREAWYRLTQSKTQNSVIEPAAKPAGIDIDVTYISRTPRYAYNAAKTWPSPGDTVTFTAHIINKGTADSGSFQVQWLVDGLETAAGTIDNLSPQQETMRTLSWDWQDGRHTITFIADSAEEIAETFEQNNRRDEFTDALTISFWVEETVYDHYNSLENDAGTYSWEDWAQQIPDHFNYLFATSRYPDNPDGVQTRLRLDKVTIVEDYSLGSHLWLGAPDDPLFDLSQGFRMSEYGPAIVPWESDWMVAVHEAGHKLFGLDDLYGLNVPDYDVFVTNDQGKPIAGTTDLPNISHVLVHTNSRPYDVMASPVLPDLVLSDHTVAILNTYWPQGVRSIPGWAGSHDAVGKFLLDLPAETKLRVLDKDGQPISGVEISAYRTVLGTGSDYYSKDFDDAVDLMATTDAGGLVSLGARPFGDLMFNVHPYQRVTSGIVLLKLHDPVSDLTQYHWLELVPLNLAYWRGETALYVHAIYFKGGARALHLSTTSVEFTAVAGGTKPDPINVDVHVSGVAPRVWEPVLSIPSWLEIVPGQPSKYAFSVYPSGPLTLRADPTGLDIGEYTASVGVKTAVGVTRDAVQKITVKLTIEEQKLQAALTVCKHAVPSLDSVFAFGGDLGQFTLSDPGSACITFSELEAGTYKVNETLSDDWYLSAIYCGKGVGTVESERTGSEIAVTVPADTAVTCTFHNEKDAYEPNNTVETAASIVFGDTVTAVLMHDYQDAEDYYAFDGRAGLTATVQVQGDQDNGDVQPKIKLFNAAGDEVSGSVTGDWYNQTGTYLLPADGRYIILIETWCYQDDGCTGLYTLLLARSNTAPTAAADGYIITAGETFAAAAPGVLGNDLDDDGDALTAVLTSDALHGAVDLEPDGAFTYTPDSGYIGPDRFWYQADDSMDGSEPAAVTITIVPRKWFLPITRAK